MSKACLVDTTRCIGCRSCQVACKQWNEMPAEETAFHATGGGYENPPRLSTKTRTRVTFHEVADEKDNFAHFVFVKRQCMHCLEPACASACLVKALEKTPEGPVIWHKDLCMGCRYCMIACPFDIPKFEYEKAIPNIQKCTFCFDRIQRARPSMAQLNGQVLSGTSLQHYQQSVQTPACAKACPTRAILFGERDDLLEEARSRIYGKPEKKYLRHIYGEHEVGGTSWLYITNVPFEKLGFQTNLPTTPLPEGTKGFLNSVPLVILLWAGFGTGLHWFTQRRKKVVEAEGTTSENQEA